MRPRPWAQAGATMATSSRRWTSAVGLSRVPSAGGTPVPVTKLNSGEATHRWPQVLPGSQAILFTASAAAGNFDDANIDVISLKTGERKTVARGGFSPRYLPTATGTGHLIYLHQSTLFAVPFDPGRLAAIGSPAPILEDVSSNGTAGGDFAFARNGTFVYLSGKGQASGLVDFLGGSLRQDAAAAGGARPLPHAALLARRQAAGVFDGQRPGQRHLGEGSGPGHSVAAEFPAGLQWLAGVDSRREEHRVPIQQPGAPGLYCDPLGRIGRGAASDRRQASQSIRIRFRRTESAWLFSRPETAAARTFSRRRLKAIPAHPQARESGAVPGNAVHRGLPGVFARRALAGVCVE